MENEIKHRVGLSGLIALIVGGTIGSGIFALPATLTAAANPAAILLGWVVVATGMVALAGVYRDLTLNQPEIDDGIYGWSKAIGGHMGGFIASYGHGMGDAVGNASYLTVIFSALGSFDALKFFGTGTSWSAIIAASAALWLVTFLALRGVKESAWLNNLVTIAKIIPLALFIILALWHFSPTTFMAHFFDLQVYNAETKHFQAVSLFDQSKSVLLAAMWTLVGIESGTIFATRAKKLSDVAKATSIGALIVIVLLVGVSCLALGLMAPAQISQLHAPSLAGLMDAMVGTWGRLLINVCLIIAVCGALVAWVNLASEELRLMGRGKSATSWFNRLNANEAPHVSLLLTSGVTQVLLIVAGLYSAGYLELLKFSTSLAIVPYLLASIYGLKSALGGYGYPTKAARLKAGLRASVATLFTLVMLVGAGVQYLLLGAIVWGSGFGFYYMGKNEQNAAFSLREKIAWGVIFLMALGGIYGMISGVITF